MRRLLLLLAAFELSAGHMDTSGCGTTKKCVFVPAGCQEKNNCQQIFSYNTPNGEGWTDMELFSSNENPNNNYIAVGFSEDDSMGDDHVTHCAFVEGSQPEVHLTYNFGKSNAGPMEPQDQTMEKENLRMIHAHKADDGMYCSFKQKTATTKSQYLPELDKEKVIFVVRGNARKPRALGIHSLDPASPDFPFISEQKLNVGAPQALAPVVNATTPESAQPAPAAGSLSKETRFFLVKIHAALMIVAWMIFVPIAIFSARYLRDHFSNSQPCGLKMWFHFHRTLNFFAIPLILLGTFIIFLSKDFTWKGPTANGTFEQNTTPSAVHTLLGVIAVCLAILQPIMAFLRCAPEASARPVFNYTHRSVGIIAVVGGLIATLIGANSFKSLWIDPQWSFWIVVFYIIVTVLAIIIFEVLSNLKKKPSAKTIDFEMRNRMRHGGFADGPMPHEKIVEKKPLWALSFLFVLFVLFAISISIALVILMFLDLPRFAQRIGSSCSWETWNKGTGTTDCQEKNGSITSTSLVANAIVIKHEVMAGIVHDHVTSVLRHIDFSETESWSVLRYNPGGHYAPHYEYLDYKEPSEYDGDCSRASHSATRSPPKRMSQLSETETINSDEDCFQERKKFPLPSSAPPPSQETENGHSPLNTPASVPQLKLTPSLPNPALLSASAPIFFPMGFPNTMMDPRALGFPLPMMMPQIAMHVPIQQPPPQSQKESQLPKVETRTTEEILKKIFEKPLIVEKPDCDVADDKKAKRKSPSIIRTPEFDWDSQHRRENSAFERGTVILRCQDVDSDFFEDVIWFVDGHQLLQKYICVNTDPSLGKVFVKTHRYIGWLADEPWSYYRLNGCILLDEARERIGVNEFPTRDTVRQHCLSGRENNQFYETIVQKFGAPRWPAPEDGEETTTNHELYKTLVQNFMTPSWQAPEAGDDLRDDFEVKAEVEDGDEPVEMKYIPPSQD